jgi:hypothetical protein
MVDATPCLELCVGRYKAEHVLGNVLVYAFGVHATSGYHTLFSIDASEEECPTLSVWHIKLEGIALQVVTPFSISTSFQTVKTLKRVRLRDSNGVHEIDVESMPALIAAHAR